jgi:hypothetical protein
MAACTVSLFMFALQAQAIEDGYVSAGIGQTRILEAEKLLHLSSDVIVSLPAGHPAKDDVRAFRSKLESLRSVAQITDPADWDTMLHALLEADYYGEESLTRLLRPDAHSSASGSGMSCESAGEGAELSGGTATSNEGDAGRRLDSTDDEHLLRAWGLSCLQFLHTVRQGVRSTVTMLQRSLNEWLQEWLAVTPTPREQAILWWQSMLNRPPPWERDCDCCFQSCPPDHNCLKQVGNMVSIMISEHQWSCRKSLMRWW